MTPSPSLEPRDFFISYTQADLPWARWVAQVLEEAGFSTCYQDRDFRGNFIDAMRDALLASKRVVGVMSPAALASPYVRPEWNAAFNEGARLRADRLVLLRVQACEADPLLRQIAFTDLVDLPENEARARVLARIGAAPPSGPAAFPGPAPGRAPYPAAADDARRAEAARALLRAWRLAWGARAGEIEAAAGQARDMQWHRAPAPAKPVFALADEVGNALRALPLEVLHGARFHGLQLEPAVVTGIAMTAVHSVAATRARAPNEYAWASAARVLESALALLRFDLDRLPRGYRADVAVPPPADLRRHGPLLLLRVAGESGLRLCSAAAPDTPLARLAARERDLKVLAARLDAAGQLQVIGSDDEFVYAWSGASALPVAEAALDHAQSAVFTGAGPQAGVLVVAGGVVQHWHAGALEPVAQGGVPWVDRDGRWRLLHIDQQSGACSAFGKGTPEVTVQPWNDPQFEGFAADLGPLWNNAGPASVQRLAGLDAALFMRYSAWGCAFFFADPETLRPLRPRLFVRNTHLAVLSATIAGGRWLVLTAVQGDKVSPRLAVFDLEHAGAAPAPACDLVAPGDLEAPVVPKASHEGFELVAALRDLSGAGDGAARLVRYEWPARRSSDLLAAPDLAAWGVAPA